MFIGHREALFSCHIFYANILQFSLRLFVFLLEDAYLPKGEKDQDDKTWINDTLPQAGKKGYFNIMNSDIG